MNFTKALAAMKNGKLVKISTNALLDMPRTFRINNQGIFEVKVPADNWKECLLELTWLLKQQYKIYDPVRYFDWAEAQKLLLQGKRVARKHWDGYWYKIQSTGAIKICYIGRSSTATMYRENMLATDWYEVQE